MPNRQHAIRFESDALGTTHVEVARLEGREAIGALFELEVTVVTNDPAGLPVDDLVGADARLVFELDGREVRRLGGMIAVVDDLLDPESRFATYRALFVPRAYRLTQRETLDVHLDLSEPELFAKKLEEIGLARGEDFELRLVESYPKRDLVVQYRETDLAFVSRLAEHLGISFWVEAREGRDVVVFADSNAGFSRPDPDLPVPVRGRGDGRDVYVLEQRSRVVPTKHVVRDYNYRNPGLDLTATAELEGGSGSVVEYGAHFKDPAGGARFARIRLEEQLCRSKTFRGRSDLPGLVVGSRVVLEGHPRGDLEVIVTEVVHRGVFGVFGGAPPDGRGYANELVALRAGIPFRPARVTPKPRVHGVMTGVVDGASDSGYAQIDEEGRYRVKFMFDTADRDGGQASRPIRMAQPHAGEGYGMHFPLRAGVEVIITCVDGDPDRPIIAGTVPNPATPSPVAAANGTRNVIRTGGGNQIDLDDTDGAQRIKLSSPRMNTVFQLGEPNAPELGAILSTSGAATTFAVGGSSLVSSVDTTVTTLRSLKTAGDLTSVASKSGVADRWLAVNSLIDTAINVGNVLYDSAQAVISGYLAIVGAVEGAKQSEVDAQQAHVDAQKVAADAAGEALGTKLDAAPVDATKTAIKGLLADYEKACETADESQTDADEARDALDEAGRRRLDLNADGKGSGDQLVADRQTAYDAACARLAEDVGDRDAKYDALRKALGRKIGDEEGDAVDAAYATEADAYLTALELHEDGRKSLDSKKDELAEIKKFNATETYELNESITAQAFAGVKTAGEVTKTVTGTISAALTLYNTIQGIKTQTVEATNWAAYGLAVRKTTPAFLSIPLPLPAKAPPAAATVAAEISGIAGAAGGVATAVTAATGGPPTTASAEPVRPRGKAGEGAEWQANAITGKERATNTVGADDNMLVFGGRILSLRSNSVGLLSTNEATIYSAKDASLLSSERAEVKGLETTYLGGKTIDALAGETFKVVSGETISLGIDPAQKTSTTGASSTATPVSSLEIEQSEASLKVGTVAKLALEEAGDVTLDAKALTITTKDKATIDATTDLKATAKTSAKIEVGASTLDLMTAKASIAKGDSSLLLSDSVAKLARGSDAHAVLSSAGVHLKGANITLAGDAAVKVDGKVIQLG